MSTPAQPMNDAARRLHAERVRNRVADELAENDAAGAGPVSRQEYLDDAEAILRMVEPSIRQDQTRRIVEWLRESIGSQLGKRAADIFADEMSREFSGDPEGGENA